LAAPGVIALTPEANFPPTELAFTPETLNRFAEVDGAVCLRALFGEDFMEDFFKADFSFGALTAVVCLNVKRMSIFFFIRSGMSMGTLLTSVPFCPFTVTSVHPLRTPAIAAGKPILMSATWLPDQSMPIAFPFSFSLISLKPAKGLGAVRGVVRRVLARLRGWDLALLFEPFRVVDVAFWSFEAVLADTCFVSVFFVEVLGGGLLPLFLDCKIFCASVRGALSLELSLDLSLLGWVCFLMGDLVRNWLEGNGLPEEVWILWDVEENGLPARSNLLNNLPEERSLGVDRARRLIGGVLLPLGGGGFRTRTGVGCPLGLSFLRGL